MSQLWISTLERWNSLNDKKLNKFKKVVLQFTSKRTYKDVLMKMSEIPRESMTSLYQVGTLEDIHNSINASEDNSLIQKNASIITVEDGLNNKKEISINLDSLSKSEEIIQTSDFKIKIIQEKDLQSPDDSKLIKLKIILPKGSSQKRNSIGYRSEGFKPEESSQKQNSFSYKTEGFKPEDFSIVSEQFVAFANSLIDADPNGDELTCSSPLPKITYEQSAEKVTNEILNNTVDIQSDKETKLVEFINNTSTESLDLSLLQTEKFFDSLEDFEKIFYVDSSQTDQHVDGYELTIDALSISLPSKLEDDNTQRIQHLPPIEENNYYNDLRKRHFYNGNLKNIEYETKFSFNSQNVTRHSLDNGDYKYLKSSESVTEDFHKDNSETKLPLSKLRHYNPKEAMNHSINCPPIMGKNALLAKSNAMKRNTNRKDSEIIEQLVRDRFKDFLNNYRLRSLKRSLLKRNSTIETINDEKTNDNTNNFNLTKEVPKIHITPDTAKPNNSEMKDEVSDVSHQDQIQRLDICKISDSITSDAGFVSGSTGKLNKLPEVALSPTSSVSTCGSENFGEFVTSGLFDNINDNELGNKFVYDSQEFLMEAFGDIMKSSETITNNIEDFPTYTTHFNERTMSEEHSVCTSEMSILVSHPTTSIPSTLSERHARNNSFTTIKSSSLEELANDLTTNYVPARRNDEMLVKLTQNSAIQYEIIQQTTKALEWCRSRKEFQSSIEQIEAEKILLIATCQREILLAEINRLESEDYSEYNGHLGSVQLSNLKFPARSDSDSLCDLPKKSKEFSQWFVCIAHCGSTLHATNAILADADGNVEFADKFTFEDLTPQFEITVSIYSLSVKANVRNYNHDSKYHLNRSTKTCPSPSKFLTFRRKSSSRLPQATEIPSGFTLWGKTSLKVCDLAKPSQFQMADVPTYSTLKGRFYCTFNSSLKVEERFSGFLNIGTQSSGEIISWNKRWCSMYNTELRYWNYPCEEGNSPPLEVIDLGSCANAWISTVDRSICARSKTLLLETIDGSQITKYFLNADTVEDMRNWGKSLNSVVSSLRMWHCMKRDCATKSAKEH